MTNMYECLNLLGEGSTCKVYSVKDKVSKHIMASKCIKKEYIFLRKDNERYVMYYVILLEQTITGNPFNVRNESRWHSEIV